MPDTLCRVIVEVTGADQAGSVDLVLPSRCPLGELMPSLVCTIFGDTADVAQRWYLARAAGTPLDTALSLCGNDIRDGDIVVLSSAPVPRPRLTPTDPCGVVASAADFAPLQRRVVVAAAAVGTLLAAAALVWAGLQTATPWHAVSAATLSVVAAAAAAAIGRADRGSSLLSCLGSVVFAGAAGVLAVPGAGWEAASLLAASSALAMSTVLMRLTGDHGIVTAFAAAAGAVSAAAGLGIAVGPRLDVTGVALAIISIAALSAAPRIAALAAGLGPSRVDIDADRADGAHRILSGLVAGWSASALLGVGTVAAGTVHQGSSASLAACFAADVGALLILRQRSHVDPCRRAWLSTAGSGALLSAFGVAVAAAPAQAHWTCMAAAIGCAVCVWCTHRPIELNPLLRRGVHVVEYAALVAVVPLAFWMTGVYGFVRESSLS